MKTRPVLGRGIARAGDLGRGHLFFEGPQPRGSTGRRRGSHGPQTRGLLSSGSWSLSLSPGCPSGKMIPWSHREAGSLKDSEHWSPLDPGSPLQGAVTGRVTRERAGRGGLRRQPPPCLAAALTQEAKVRLVSRVSLMAPRREFSCRVFFLPPPFKLNLPPLFCSAGTKRRPVSVPGQCPPLGYTHSPALELLRAGGRRAARTRTGLLSASAHPCTSSAFK